MSLSNRSAVAVALVIGALGAIGGAWWTRHAARPVQPAPAVTAGAADSAHQVLYWYDPMAPAQHFDRPGKSPYMDMQLVPRYADDDSGESAGIRIDPRLSQNLGVRLARVETRVVSQSIDVPGTVVFNGRETAIVQARTAGFVTRVHARAPGDRIARNAPIVDLLVPEWAAAQSEYLVVLERGDAALRAAARQRLTMLGMSADLIARLESSHQVHAEVTVSAPLAGIIDTLDGRAGMAISGGSTLATIKGIDPIWIEAAVPERSSQAAVPGGIAMISSPAFPGATFRGRIVTVLPQLDAATHTLRVRIELPNRSGQWKPGMFAQVGLRGQSLQALLVASEAVIHTGTRDLVIVATEGNRYQAVEVRVGAQFDGQTQLLDGVHEGQQVVASGQFLLDSEANLRSAAARMDPAPGGKSP